MLNKAAYLIRERVGFLKLTDVYDIFDPLTSVQIGVAKEEIGLLLKVLRLLLGKNALPTEVKVYEGTAENPIRLVFSIKKPMTFFRSKIQVLGSNREEVGYFVSKLISLGGGFRVYLSSGQEIASIKGDWKGWNFKFLSGETELGSISKKWSGFGKELFTSADNYVVSINGEPDENIAILLLAAGLAVDTVLKEKQ